MPYARNGLLIAGVLAGVAYAASAAVPWALLFYSALAGYVLLHKASWRLRLPLLMGLMLVAAATLPIGNSVEEFGFMSYGPPGGLDLTLQRMAELSLMSIAWMGLAILVGYACLCAAVWALPRRRDVVLAVDAALIAAGFVAAAVLTLSDVDARLAVWVAGLGLLAGLAIAAVASQRAGMAWLTVAGAALLAWQSLGLLEQAAINAALASGPADRAAFLGMAIMVQTTPDLGQALLLAAGPSGILLVVLGCCLRAPAPMWRSPSLSTSRTG